VRRARISVGELDYLDEGEGPPVVLLHGLGSSSELWRHVVPFLIARTRVVVPDFPDVGWNAAARARNTGELLDTLEINRFAAVGHGLGGVVAQLIAIGGGAECLVLIDAGPVDPGRGSAPGPDLDPSMLRQIEAPTLIVWGEDDPYLQVGVAEGLADALPHSSLVLLPGCSHFVPQEAPDTLGPLVAEFLRVRYLGLPHDHDQAHGQVDGPVPIELHRTRGPA